MRLLIVIAVIADCLVLAITDAHIDRLFDFLNKALDQSGHWLQLLTTLMGAWLIYRQQQNKKEVKAAVADTSAKVDQNTQMTSAALDTANGHNAKIAAVTDAIAEVKQAAEEVKQAVADAKQPATG